MSAADDILKDLHDRIGKTLDTLRHDLSAVRTGRASLHLLDNVKVDYNVTKLMQSPNMTQSPGPSSTRNPGAGSNQIEMAPQSLVQQQLLNQDQFSGATSTVSSLQAVSQNLGLSVSPFSQ